MRRWLPVYRHAQMRLLLDFQIAPWAVVADLRLPAKARDLILDSGNMIHVSAARIVDHVHIGCGIGRALPWAEVGARVSNLILDAKATQR